MRGVRAITWCIARDTSAVRYRQFRRNSSNTACGTSIAQSRMLRVGVYGLMEVTIYHRQVTPLSDNTWVFSQYLYLVPGTWYILESKTLVWCTC